jgi:hypothetical protein
MTPQDIISLYINKLITRTEARKILREKTFREYGVGLNDAIDLLDLYNLDYVGVKR